VKKKFDSPLYVQNTDAASNGMFSRIISFRERERERDRQTEGRENISYWRRGLLICTQ